MGEYSSLLMLIRGAQVKWYLNCFDLDDSFALNPEIVFNFICGFSFNRTGKFELLHKY